MRVRKVRIPGWTLTALSVDQRKTPNIRLQLIFLCVSLLYLNTGELEAHGQDIEPRVKALAQRCPDPAPQTSGSHAFRREGETIDIPINVADCESIAFALRWSNGGNNGSSLVVTFLDDKNQPIHSRSLSIFLSGSFEFPFASIDQQPWFARGSVVAVPTTVVIQARAPFAAPANISYAVTRKAGSSRLRHQTEVEPVSISHSSAASARPQLLDDQIAMKLRTMDGRLLSEGHGSGFSDSIRYKLKEVALPDPREIEIHGRREKVEFAYRLTLAGGKLRASQPGSTGAALSTFGLIWLDDAALPAFSLDSQEISTLIYDRSILRDGAEVSVSSVDGDNMHTLGELKYHSSVQLPASNFKSKFESKAFGSTSTAHSNNEWEEGNEVVGIRSAVRVIGATRAQLVQIELRTNRPFPLRDSALLMQVGKRFFVNELTGDHTGRTLMLTLTRNMFAELEQGAEIVAFFGTPDRSGFSGRGIWHFGKLDKGRMH